MTLCPVKNNYHPEKCNLMIASNSTSSSRQSNGGQPKVASHDTSNNSVPMSQLQLLKHSIFSETCAQEKDGVEQTETTEAELESSSSLDGPAQWIRRACRGLWEQCYKQLNESGSETGEGIERWRPSGATLIKGLTQVSGKPDRLLATAVWQILLDESAIEPMDDERTTPEKGKFVDQDDVFFQCTCTPEPGENSFYESVIIPEDGDELRSFSAPEDKVSTISSPVLTKTESFRLDSLELDDTPKPENKLRLLIDRLYDLASDDLFRRILQKQPSLRTQTELDFVFYELHLVPALSGLSRNVRHELSRCLIYEVHSGVGSTVFSQGDPGTSWYIIHRGSVWVYVKGQGSVCRLSEGDDFGKLALITGAPRAASILLAEENCHFLKVEKDDFDRILRDLEANIVRLKEQDSDVLILERLLDTDELRLNNTSPSRKSEHSDKKTSHSSGLNNYSIKAGTTEKIVQHLLDLRLGGMEHQVASLLDSKETQLSLCPRLLLNEDSSLEDFILTYTLYTSDDVLFDLLMNYAQSEVALSSAGDKLSDTTLHVNRVLVFVYCWCQCIGLALFTQLDHIDDFLRQLHDFIVQHFPSTVQLKVISRLLLECEPFLRVGNPVPDHSSETMPVFTTATTSLSSSTITTVSGATNTTTNSTGSTRTTTPNTFYMSSAPVQLPIRRCASSRKRFTRLRQTDPASAVNSESPTKCNSTGLVSKHQNSLDCATSFTRVESYPPALAHCSFSPNRLPFTDQHHVIKFPVYLDGGHKKQISVRLNCTVEEIKQQLSQYLPEKSPDMNQYKLVEISSKGDRLVFENWERGIVLGLSPNSCLFLVPADKVQSLVPLPVQMTVAMNFLENHDLERHRPTQELHHKEVKPNSPMLRRMASTAVTFRALDELSVDEIATVLTLTSVRVAVCIGPKELINYTLGSKKSNSATAHVRLLVSHFSLIHMWTITQLVTCTSANRRVQLLKKFIKIADRLIDAPFYDQHTCFAILLGLHSTPVARLTHTWERVPLRWRRVYFNRLVPLIDPGRNHRAGRMWIVSTQPPHLPFLALVLKDLRFAEDANQTYYSDQAAPLRLINFDKVRLISRSLRLWNRAMSGYDHFHPQANKLRNSYPPDQVQPELPLLQKANELPTEHLQIFFENFECIDDIRVLTQLSLRLEPKRS